MQTEAKIDVVRRLCIDAILYHQDATTLLNAVYAKIQIPLIAFDETIALIAYAFPRPFYFEDWEEIVEYGTCPKKKVLQNLRDYQEVIYRNRAPTVISWGTCAELPQICCPIICRDFLYGYIGMAPQAGSDMEEMSVIEAMLAKTLGRILNDEQRTDVLAPEQYVSHLLMRDKPDYKVLDAYGKHFAPPYLFVMLMSPVVNEAELQYVLGHICRTQPQVIGCASESRYLYLLVAGMDSDTARVMINRHLRAVALQTDYYVSFSDVFYDIRTLPQHKLQATLSRRSTPRSAAVSTFPPLWKTTRISSAITRSSITARLPFCRMCCRSWQSWTRRRGRTIFPRSHAISATPCICPQRHTRSTCTPIRSAADSSASAASPDWIWRIMTR